VSTALVWREEALTRHHDRAGFDCGVPALNEYLRRYARQNHDSGGAKTFVAVAPEAPTIILGYYTISPGDCLCESSCDAHEKAWTLRSTGVSPRPSRGVPWRPGPWTWWRSPACGW